MTLPRIYPNPTPKQHQFQLTTAIFGVLATYGRKPQLLFTNGQPEPVGNWLRYLQIHPADAVIAEVLGTAVTIQITKDYVGEIPVPDALHFCCYDFETFRFWFAEKIKSAEPIKPATSALMRIRRTHLHFPKKK